MTSLGKKATIIFIVFLFILTGCQSKQLKDAYKSKDAVIINKYIRYIDNYLKGENEFVFNSSKELSSGTLYEFIHFINAKERMNIVKYDSGKFYISMTGAEWVFEHFFNKCSFNEAEIIDYEKEREAFIGPIRRYKFDLDNLECIYLRSKDIKKGNLVLVVDYYDPFDIQKVSKLYSKTYTIKIDEYGYKYISVIKNENKSQAENLEQKDNSYYLNYYIKPLVNSGLAQQTWNRAEELDANILLYYACIPFLNSNIDYDDYLVEEGDNSYLHIPARIIEKQLHQKFNLPQNFLKLTDAYNPKDNSYVSSFGYGSGYEPILNIIDVNKEDSKLIITFEKTEPSESNLNELVTSLIELTIDESGERFKYESCKVLN